MGHVPLRGPSSWDVLSRWGNQDAPKQTILDKLQTDKKGLETQCFFVDVVYEWRPTPPHRRPWRRRRAAPSARSRTPTRSRPPARSSACSPPAGSSGRRNRPRKYGCCCSLLSSRYRHPDALYQLSHELLVEENSDLAGVHPTVLVSGAEHLVPHKLFPVELAAPVVGEHPHVDLKEGPSSMTISKLVPTCDFPTFHKCDQGKCEMFSFCEHPL